MANTTINYVSLQRLAYYDGKIKAFLAAADAATLKVAQDYCDSLAENYDAAGVAASLVQALENGQVKANKEAIEALQGKVTTLEGTVATQGTDIENMKGQIDALEKGTYDDTEVRGLIKDNADAIDALEAKDTELAGQISTLSQTHADDKAALEADIKENADAIALLNNASTVEGSVDYKIAQAVAAIIENPDETMNSINELVTWCNDHAADALELSNTVAGHTTDIEALEKLVGTTGVAEQITAAIEAALKIDGVDKYALASDLTAAIARIAALEAKAHEHANKAELDLIATGDKAKWDAMEQNAKDYADGIVATEKERAEGVEGGLETRLQAVEAQLGDGENSVSDLIATAKGEAIDESKEYADGLNEAMDTRVKAVEAAKHTHSNQTVLDGVTAEKVAAWDASEQNAKDYADGLDEAMDTRVKVVEGKAHEHANKALLDTYTQTEANLADAVSKKHEHANAAELAKIEDGDVAKWDEAYTKAHEHTNKSVLDGITSGKVSAWDAAEQNAKNFATQEIAKIDTGVMAVATGSANGTVAVDGTDVAVKGLGSAAYTAASAYDAAGAAATAESNAKAFATEEIGKIDLSGIDTNASAITALQGEDTAIKGRLDALESVTHTEITEAEIDAMFQTQA